MFVAPVGCQARPHAPETPEPVHSAHFEINSTEYATDNDAKFLPTMKKEVAADRFKLATRQTGILCQRYILRCFVISEIIRSLPLQLNNLKVDRSYS